jgi:hypothetical protein
MKKFKFSCLILLVLTSYSFAESITVYKSPTCGCCQEWMTIMETKGHDVTGIHPDNLQTLKDQYSIPTQLRSCHTAVIGDYIFEGHVPEADILLFLANPPKGAKGLAVPAMPAHSPGMAAKGQRYRDFNVVLIGKDNKLSLFNRY